MSRPQAVKRKFQIVLQDPYEIPHRKCITSIIAPDPVSMGGNLRDFKNDKHSLLFTASRDRMVKLWSVSFAAGDKTSKKESSKLLANFDGHMDWVN
jgi:hypothetical protein